MTQVKGIDFIVSVNTGTQELPVFTKIGFQRGATLNRSSETLETTSKNSNGYKEFEYGFKEWSIDADGLYSNSEISYQYLENAFMEGTKVKVQFATPSGEQYEGMALITDMPLEAPYDDMATWSCAFTGSGELTKVTA